MKKPPHPGQKTERRNALQEMQPCEIPRHLGVAPEAESGSPPMKKIWRDI
jgi:hypothetical protein